MPRHTTVDLWGDFPRTAGEFEARFATEADCRAYWIQARWGGTPACARCGSTRVWVERNGFLLEWAECGHQISLTLGTLLEKTRTLLKTWFRAIFQIRTRRTGISAKDLQRILGVDSYKTAWCWVPKLRAAMVRSGSEPLGPFVQMDEALVGGRGRRHKELALVAAEASRRVRLAHAETNDEATLKRFADGEVAPNAHVATDGLASYSKRSLGDRGHDMKMQTKAEPRQADALQGCHWTTSRLERALLGTHAGAVRAKDLQSYLDEFAFRRNRRKTNGVGRIAARLIERLVAAKPLTMKTLIKQTRRCRCFPLIQAAPA